MKKYTPIITLFAIVIGMVVLYWALSANYLPELTNRGLFGDSFGGLTSLFSGLAFAGMIYAIIMQSQELKLQREELTLTRKELEATRKEQERSANAQNSLVNNKY